jgi:peptidoglycan/xylan/chitin deacetylase (PgdA/CDA1 family)/cellulose synthase/poly-beta-1,6-N-acetylglucosamine synthase-like glycosyltransferase
MKHSFKRKPGVFTTWSSPSIPSGQTGATRQELSGKSWLLRAWLVLATLWLTIYVVFRFHYVNLSPGLAFFSILVCLAEMHILLHLYGMFYSLWPRRYQTWEALNTDRNLRCNLFVCVCGEPPEVVRETILAALETARVYRETINPIHPPRVIVLNDGKVAKKDNWQAIEAICTEVGAEHIARDVPGGFKAGNINNGLKQTANDDPHNTLDIVFDSDFCALPEFLVEITKPFADTSIDFVQSPQRYKNETTWVAKAAAAHQIFFFDYICPAKGHDNALFLCGTNFAIRRSALDAVGGLEDRFITEDYATSLDLHLAGRKGVFMRKVLALGMAPTSLKQYFTQQKRWSKGNFDVTGAYFKQLLCGPLTLKQKMHYMLSATYYLIGLRDLILMLAPLPYLFLGESLIRPNSLQFILFIYAPLFLANTFMYLRLFRFPIKSLILDLVSFPIFTAALWGAIFKEKLGFVVTIKKYERENPLSVYKPQIVVALLLASGLSYSLLIGRSNGFGSLINYWWAFFNTVFLSMGFYLLVVENARWKVWEAAPSRNRQRVPAFGRLTVATRGLAVIALPLTLWAWVGDNPANMKVAGVSSFKGLFTAAEPFKPQPLLAAPEGARGQVFYQVPVKANQKVIALTFDDGPYPEYTEQVLDVLREHKVKATFYMIGQRIAEYPNIARQVASEGHDIGNHSWSHAAKPADPHSEVKQTSKIMRDTLGVAPTHFRPPMGIMDNGMVQHAQRQKHAVMLWSCDTKDWSGLSAQQIYEAVVKQAHPGGVVLLHDGGGDRSATVQALPLIIEHLRKQGYSFVTVPQLLHLDENKARFAANKKAHSEIVVR